MLFQFYFKKIPSSEFLKTLSQRKFTDVVERFVGQAGLVHVTFQQEKNEHKVHCRLHSWNRAVLHASGSNENMYIAIDQVAQRLEAQLARHKMRAQRRLRPTHEPLPLGSHSKTQATQLEAWADETPADFGREYRALN